MVGTGGRYGRSPPVPSNTTKNRWIRGRLHGTGARYGPTRPYSLPPYLQSSDKILLALGDARYGRAVRSYAPVPMPARELVTISLSCCSLMSQARMQYGHVVRGRPPIPMPARISVTCKTEISFGTSQKLFAKHLLAQYNLIKRTAQAYI